MALAFASLGFAVALICAGLMGYAIQRGATCTVVAVNEIIEQRRARRLLAMVEASLWVTGGLLLAQAAGVSSVMPPGFATSGWTVLGGMLLGLGAFLNGACVFGAIARLGSGEWAFLATPIGFYLGCLSFPALFALPAPARLPENSLVLGAPAWLSLAFLGFATWRVARPSVGVRSRTTGALGAWARELASLVWSPHAATSVIAVTFVILLLLAGAWSYTDALAGLARRMADGLSLRSALLLALLLGAIAGGWTAGRLKARRPSMGQVLRCLGGGAAMAWGGLLVPGSNDGLILLGMPLLFPYAWVAFLTMCGAIAAARLARDAVMARRPAPVGPARP